MILVQYIISTSTHGHRKTPALHTGVCSHILFTNLSGWIFFVHHQKGRAFPSIFRVSLVPDTKFIFKSKYSSHMLEDPLYVFDEMLPSPAARRETYTMGLLNPECN